jgi:Putative adhesin
MSSPVVTPRPRRRSLAGPVVLIIMGLVFLLVTMHQLSLGRLATLWAHYWPALLIVWGMIKLIEYQQAQRDGVPSRGIGAGGVMLVVVVVFFGLIATQASKFNWADLRDHMDIDDSGDFSNFLGETYTFNDQLQQDFAAGSSLKVVDNHGAVSIHASDDNKITVVVHKRIGADNQGDADKYNSETKPVLTVIRGLVTLDARVEAAGDHSISTDLDISLPRKASVSIVSRRGDVNIVSREGAVDISAQRADTSVEEVTGNVKVSLEKSSAKIEQITGDVRVEGRLSEVSLVDIKGTAHLDGEFAESVKLARIAKTVTFKSSRTDMEFSKIDGELNLDSDDLHASQITGPLRLVTHSKDIRLDNVAGDVRLENANGGVELGMSSLGNVQIDNRQADIELTVPDKAGFRMDARTRDGEIQSDFGELNVTNSDREASASGSVGNASSHVVLNNEHGGIEIRKLSARATPAPAPEPPEPGEPAKAGKAAKPAKALPPPKAKVEPSEN